MKKIVISVTSDLVTDQRVHKVALAMHEKGYKVALVGRKKRDSAEIEKRPYKTYRFRLLFNKGFLFYAHYNIRLFIYLLSHKCDILIANDLDTLPANYLISKWRKKRLIYDTHEYFTGVPELLHRHFVRKVWKRMENYIFPKLTTIYTVNESIAKIYSEEYGKKVHVIRNLPFKEWGEKEANNDNFGVIPAKHSEKAVVLNLILETLKTEKRAIILYQGAVNKDRGLEELLECMPWIDNALLLIIGSGDLWRSLKQKVVQQNLHDRVSMPGAIPMQYLPYFTQLATVGLSIEKPTNINYKYASPNKVVDYIRCGVPVLASRLVEVEKLIEKYHVGTFIDSHDPIHMALMINKVVNDKDSLKKWRTNCAKASNDLVWENEKDKLLHLVDE